jgi:hypothetical protein
VEHGVWSSLFYFENVKCRLPSTITEVAEEENVKLKKNVV